MTTVAHLQAISTARTIRAGWPMSESATTWSQQVTNHRLPDCDDFIADSIGIFDAANGMVKLGRLSRCLKPV